MKNKLEKIGIIFLKSVVVVLGSIILVDLFIVANEILGNEEIVEKIDNFMKKLFS